MTGNKKLKVGDRVKRVQLPGCLGVVKDVRQEVTLSAAVSPETREKALLVTVLWDNGTQSCFGVEGLEVVKS